MKRSDDRVRNHLPMLLALPMAAWLSSVSADNQVYTYPNAGQAPEQQSRDRYECHQWAANQTGFDPSTAPPVQPGAVAMPPPEPRRSYGDSGRQGGLLGLGNGGMFQGTGVVGDAATGAALGAAGGAIAGDVGEGAAIGALASTAFGLLSNAGGGRQAPARPPADYEYERARQQQAAADQQFTQRMDRVGEYNRAFAACMTARDYTVN